MLWLKPNVERISALLEVGTPEALTYACLECRLAIELVCYDRLRVSHDYISQDDLKRWQPRDVVSRLIQDVDPHVAESLTLSISSTPTDPSKSYESSADYDEHDYIEVGKQVGFDARHLGKLWNALGSFLHVHLPTSTTSTMEAYGDVGAMSNKCNDVLIELRRLSEGTLVMTGVGEEVSFECVCGSKNKRRAKLLTHGQVVSCINPECVEKWEVMLEESGDTVFKRRTIKVPCCACPHVTVFPEAPILKIEHNRTISFTCQCGATNLVAWRLMRADKPQEPKP